MATLLVVLLQIIWLVLLARVVFSWVRPRPGSAVRPIADAVESVTEPIVAPVRRLLPPTGGFDFSVTIVLLLITFVLIPLAARL